MVKNNSMDIATRCADNIRILSAAMVEKAGSGHPGGAMGGADFIQILYSEFLRYNPDDPQWIFRDRFFLDPGHMSAMLYAQLSLTGMYSMEDLKQFRQWGSSTPGHPELDIKRGVENTSGPLGQGHVMAVGAAIAAKFLAERFGNWIDHKIYTFISDGGIQEEVSQGAGRIAGHLGLNNLIMFYDANKVQLSTLVSEVTSEKTAMKYRAWGWKVITINGNNPVEIRSALFTAHEEKKKPVLIIGKTIMGKGAVDENGDSFEGKCSTHGQPLSKAGACFKTTLVNLGGCTEEPFKILPEVKEYYKGIQILKRASVERFENERSIWKKEHPILDEKLRQFLNLESLGIDLNSIIQKRDISTREASSEILKVIAQKDTNILVMSADLANSDKTDGFLKESQAIRKDDFSGAFLHAGVSELTMACLANGMVLHGGVRPVCGTFFVFSDYMKPAVRMAALMELPVIYIWTHDSYKVGEDGPTHQPIEHEAQIRLMEHLRNHSGERSLIILRPADSLATNNAWQLALRNIQTPSALILSRQNIKSLSNSNKNTGKDYTKGAEIVYGFHKKPDITIIATGAEASLGVNVAELITEEKSLQVNVVSVLSVGILLDQEKEYIHSLINKNSNIIGISSGLPQALADICAIENIIGLNHFGYSAPAFVLDSKFGFSEIDLKNRVLNIFDRHQ